MKDARPTEQNDAAAQQRVDSETAEIITRRIERHSLRNPDEFEQIISLIDKGPSELKLEKMTTILSLVDNLFPV
jgi:hypothetical protein